MRIGEQSWMSKVYRESKESKRQYFEQEECFKKLFNKYYFNSNSIVETKSLENSKLKFQKGGVPLSLEGQGECVYVDQTDNHTLVIGPTGSKKSRLVAIPTVEILCASKESMIISDPKAEIYIRTAKKLSEEGYKVKVLNLRAPEIGECWNPLAIPYKFFCEGNLDKAYEFTNDIAVNLTKTDASKGDPFWDNSAGSLFFGLTILLFKYCKEFNLPNEAVHIGNVIKLRTTMLSGNDLTIRQHPLWKYAQNDIFISASLRGTIEAANETRASILSVFDQKMRIFSIQPNLVNMLGYNTIEFDKIDKMPTVIFLVLPDEKTSYHNLVSLFIKQSYEYMINLAEGNRKGNPFKTGQMKIRVNYILDEFSSLPTIKDFPAMITASRSRNIRFNLFIQSKNQLLLRYAEETDTIQSNCNNWIFLTSREVKFLQEISNLCGNTKDNSKPILSISDLQRLDKQSGEALILCGRLKPFIAKLPDINKYDNGKYNEYEYPKTKNNKKAFDLEFNFGMDYKNTKKKLENLGIQLGDNIDSSYLIQQINRKIDELNNSNKREE